MKHRWEKQVEGELETITQEEFQRLVDKAKIAEQKIKGKSWLCRRGAHTWKKTGARKRVITEDMTLSVAKSEDTIGRVYAKFTKTATKQKCTRCRAVTWSLSILSDSHIGTESEKLA